MNFLVGKPFRTFFPRATFPDFTIRLTPLTSVRYASTSSASTSRSPVDKDVRVSETWQSSKPPLSVLPLSSLVRSYAITSISSSPFLLRTSVKILNIMINSQNPFTNVERNPLLSWLLKRTFYDQFCGGEDTAEVQQYLKGLRKIGYDGTILEYALEILDDGHGSPSSDAKIKQDIETWRKGLLDSIDVLNPGDFIGLKWSGMGGDTLHLMKNNDRPSPLMSKAITDVCEAALAKQVFLLPAAEPQNVNAAVDAWNVELMQRYNKSGCAVVYNTYQAYLRSTPSTLARHLAHARKNDYTLGVKLVRGAYMDSEVRELIWDKKEETDRTYDGLAQSLLQSQYSSDLRPVPGEEKFFPSVDLVLATHNDVSVQKVRRLRDTQVAQGNKLIKLSYAQLQGMADEISCALVQIARDAQAAKHEKKLDIPRVFKCVSWGTTAQCLTFLLRRAAENKDAMGRTLETKKAMRDELKRRLGFVAT